MHKHTWVLVLILSLSIGSAAQAQMRNGLPLTSTDSFIYAAGAQADQIYGDECQVFGGEMVDYNPPPIFGFEPANRIDAGIFGDRAAGLTTGHGEYLPDAAGGDEWTGNEWDQATPSQATASPANLSLNMQGSATGINVSAPGLGLLPGSSAGINVSVPGLTLQVQAPLMAQAQKAVQTAAPALVQSLAPGSQVVINAPSGF